MTRCFITGQKSEGTLIMIVAIATLFVDTRTAQRLFRFPGNFLLKLAYKGILI